MNTDVNPSYILETATGFWASKVLLTAVEFDLFSVLGDGAMTADELGVTLELHPRVTYDFFDALVALKFLNREGNGILARYSNTVETQAFLNQDSPSYLGGLPKMLNSRSFGFWNDLGEALKTGLPQNETKHQDKTLFDELYADDAALSEFLDAMSGTQAANFQILAEKFDFTPYSTVADIGGALALLSRVIASFHSHLRFTSFDLSVVAPHAQRHIDEAKLGDKITVVSGDFFVDDLPKADVITMGNILHDWNLDKKKLLIEKIFDALPTGGVFIAIENIIDDARKENAFGLLMSLNMLIETGDGFDYTGADFNSWCSEVGFKRTEIMPLAGPTSAAIAYK